MADFAGIVPATRGLMDAPWTPASLSLSPTKKRVQDQPRGLAINPKGIEEIRGTMSSSAHQTARPRTYRRLEAIAVRLEGTRSS